MRKIIEGADMLGKSTACKWMAEQEKGTTIHHFSKNRVVHGLEATDNPLDYWVSELDSLEGVLDRGHIGGFVWGSIFGFHNWDMTWKELKYLQRFANLSGWQTFIFRAKDELWYRKQIITVSEQREEDIDIKLLLTANRLFGAFAKRLNVTEVNIGQGSYYPHYIEPNANQKDASS